jgi:hypothetical protein
VFFKLFFGWGGRGELAELNSPSPEKKRKKKKTVQIFENSPNFFILCNILFIFWRW